MHKTKIVGEPRIPMASNLSHICEKDYDIEISKFPAVVKNYSLRSFSAIVSECSEMHCDKARGMA